MWRLAPDAALERYDELRTGLPGVDERDEIADEVAARDRERHLRRRVPRRPARPGGGGHLRQEPVHHARQGVEPRQLIHRRIRELWPLTRGECAMSRIVFLAAVLATAAAAPRPAHAWETSTHVGLAEQAALAADTDAWLRAARPAAGCSSRWWCRRPTRPSCSPPSANHSAIDGYVPDLRGQQTGAGLAARRRRRRRRHAGVGRQPLLRSDHRRRLARPAPSLVDRCGPRPGPKPRPGARRAGARLGRQHRQPAGHGRLPRSIREGGRRRDARRAQPRDLAGALVAAGAVLHVARRSRLAQPRARDYAAHFDDLGQATTSARASSACRDRLGPPRRAGRRAVPSRAHWRAYFTGAGAGTDGPASPSGPPPSSSPSTPCPAPSRSAA
jgi:hypothetical protein